MNMLNVPVIFIAFNRPKHTKRALEVIRSQRPGSIFLIQDGPRKDVQSDLENCRQVRELLDEMIDWDCQVYKNYSINNLGCKKRVVTGLRWAFEIVDQAIILEDDCIPNNDFFYFCEVMLNHYKNSEDVFAITGNNFQNGIKRGDGSYYLSKYNHIWGWATWEKAIKLYDPDILFWPSWRESQHFIKIFPDKRERKLWSEKFDSVYYGRIDTWDIQWLACAFYYGWLTATPNANLVENIGFGPEATHTKVSHDAEGIKFRSLGPIKYPSDNSVNKYADNYVLNNIFLSQNKIGVKFICIKLVKKIHVIISKMYKYRNR
jgi:hypothetical protein